MYIVKDLDSVFESLVRSPFRRKFRLSARDRAYLRDKGLSVVIEDGRLFIGRHLVPAYPENDGKQTPFRGNPIFVAQHATATCCRKCLEKWHGITRGHILTADEQGHVIATLGRWLRSQEPF